MSLLLVIIIIIIIIIIVFCSIMLQRDHNVRMGCDICHLIDHRMTQWCEGQFNVLQKTAQCDHSSKFSLFV